MDAFTSREKNVRQLLKPFRMLGSQTKVKYNLEDLASAGAAETEASVLK